MFCGDKQLVQRLFLNKHSLIIVFDSLIEPPGLGGCGLYRVCGFSQGLNHTVTTSTRWLNQATIQQPGFFKLEVHNFQLSGLVSFGTWSWFALSNKYTYTPNPIPPNPPTYTFSLPNPIPNQKAGSCAFSSFRSPGCNTPLVLFRFMSVPEVV